MNYPVARGSERTLRWELCPTNERNWRCFAQLKRYQVKGQIAYFCGVVCAKLRRRSQWKRRSASQACALGPGRRAAVKELEGETHVLVCRVCRYGAYSITSPSPLRALGACDRGWEMPWEKRRRTRESRVHRERSCANSTRSFARRWRGRDEMLLSSIVADHRVNPARKTHVRFNTGHFR